MFQHHEPMGVQKSQLHHLMILLNVEQLIQVQFFDPIEHSKYPTHAHL